MKVSDLVASQFAATFVGATTQTYSRICDPVFFTLCRVAGGM